MNFEKELKKRKINIRACSVQSDIPYATLYPIIKGQVDIGTCSYFTVAKLARFLGYRPDEIVYEKEDFLFRFSVIIFITESKVMNWNAFWKSSKAMMFPPIFGMRIT